MENISTQYENRIKDMVFVRKDSNLMLNKDELLIGTSTSLRTLPKLYASQIIIFAYMISLFRLVLISRSLAKYFQCRDTCIDREMGHGTAWRFTCLETIKIPLDKTFKCFCLKFR